MNDFDETDRRALPPGFVEGTVRHMFIVGRAIGAAFSAAEKPGTGSRKALRNTRRHKLAGKTCRV